MANNFKTLTFTTASIASGSSLSTNTTGLHNYLDIIKITVTPNTAGVAFRLELYKKDTFASDICYRSRQVPGGDLLIDPFDEETGDEREEGFIVPYQDDDATGELHSKIYNYGPSSSTFTVVVVYREVSLLALVSPDESAKVNNTLANSTYLTLNVQAASVYKVRAILLHTTASANAGIKFDFNRGTATAAFFRHWAVFTGTTTVSGQSTLSGASGLNSTGAQCTIIEGLLVTTAGGTFGIRWAQNTTDAGNGTTLQEGSTLELIPLAA